MQPSFDILAAKPEQSSELDAWRKVSAARMTVVDGLLGNTQSSRQLFGGKKGIHVLRSCVMQSRDCPEYRKKVRDESVTSGNLKRSAQVLVFIAYSAEAARTGMSMQASAAPAMSGNAPCR